MEPTHSTLPLLSARELAVRVETPAQHSGGQEVLLDVRWDLGGGADPAGFAAGHLPGALFLDLEKVLTGPHQDAGAGRHPLPSAAGVRAWLDAHHVAPETPVVLMDGGHGAGAARAWWVLRDAGQQEVRVLDGGVAAWRAEGLPLEQGATGAPDRSGQPAGPSAPFTLEVEEPPTAAEDPHRLPLVDHARLLAGLPADHVLLDARPAPRYRGEDLGPDPVGGHVPGAVSLPVTDLYDHGVLRDPDIVRERFAAAGVDADTPVVVSCGSGITACQLALAHQQVFGEAAHPALHAPSFSGWIADASRPVVTGTEPGTMPRA